MDVLGDDLEWRCRSYLPTSSVGQQVNGSSLVFAAYKRNMRPIHAAFCYLVAVRSTRKHQCDVFLHVCLLLFEWSSLGLGLTSYFYAVFIHLCPVSSLFSFSCCPLFFPSLLLCFSQPVRSKQHPFQYPLHHDRNPSNSSSRQASGPTSGSRERMARAGRGTVPMEVLVLGLCKTGTNFM